MHKNMQDCSQASDTWRATPVVSIVGQSGSGKTTLLEKLIKELKARGYRVAVIKHHHHHGLQIDRPGKDTWRFTQAGADHVVLAGPDSAVHLRTFAQEPSLEKIARGIRDVDLVLTEGYKHANAPKIEISRGQTEPMLVSERGDLVALVSDQSFALSVPQFDINDISRLADFIQTRFLEQMR